MTDITVAALEAEIRRIAAENPKFVYTPTEVRGVSGKVNATQCVYYPTHGNPNGCIMGYAMRNLGHSLDDLSLNTSIADALEDLGLLQEPEADDFVRWLEWVQDKQDRGLTWGDAIELADRIRQTKGWTW